MTICHDSTTFNPLELWEDATTAWSGRLGEYRGRTNSFERVAINGLIQEHPDESAETLRETILRCCYSVIRPADRERHSERDADILVARYGLGVEKQTLQEIAQAHGQKCRESIRQKEGQALRHLRASAFLRSAAVRAHLAWLTFNDGLILPNTELPTVTLGLFNLLKDIYPGRFDLTCRDENSIVATHPWPLEQTSNAFEKFRSTYFRNGVECATKALIDCVPFALETSQYRRVVDRLSRWASEQEAVLVTGRRATLIRATLVNIGGTAHFKTIAREAATISGNACTPAYEHSIHAALTLYSDDFVRPGGRGMYALAADGFSMTDGLVEEMHKIVSKADMWLSAESVWKRLPRGNHFTKVSVAMTATTFPEVFRVTSFGLIASAEKPAPCASPVAVAVVERYLTMARSASREELHGVVTLPTDEIDAVLASEPRFLRIGSLRAPAYLCYIRPIEPRGLSKRTFLELLREDFGLATLEDAATFAMDRFGVAVSVRIMKDDAELCGARR
ncbi:MAG: hypothetical protein M3N13_11185 [Candidatus Eremiobacteraeota bacterium]|nr:hypothetical protein [Candidatus Eremiobacteraeota bacterium]